MTKELELTPAPAKKPRRVVSAINSLVERRDALTARIEAMTAERDGIQTALTALE